MSKPHHLTHKQALHFVLAFLALVFAFEALAAFHVFFARGDAMTASLIVSAWFKDGLHAVIERLAEL